MTAFNYTALDAQGRKKKGVFSADSARKVRQKLRNQGLTPLTIEAVIQKAKPGKIPLTIKRRQRLSYTHLAVITRQMATLLSANMPVAEMLTAISEQTEKRQHQAILLAIRAQVLEGHSLAHSLGVFPRAFPKIYRASVHAGEQSGELDKVLEQLADYSEKQLRAQQKVRQALIYPALMTVVSIVIVTFLLIVVVPKIINVFSQTHAALPTITVVLLAISQWLKSYGIITLLVVIIATMCTRWFYNKNRTFRARWQSGLLKLPLIGHTIKMVNSARFARTFGILFAASVPVLEAMQAASELIKPLPIQAAVAIAQQQIREGGSIAKALQHTRYFPAMSVHLIASGERSGKLEDMLMRAADNQDQSVAILIENSLTLFEPLMILLMGLVVLFIVLAIMLPIFQLDVIAGQT